jgi:hypothetical protein
MVYDFTAGVCKNIMPVSRSLGAMNLGSARVSFASEYSRTRLYVVLKHPMAVRELQGNKCFAIAV